MLATGRFLDINTKRKSTCRPTSYRSRRSASILYKNTVMPDSNYQFCRGESSLCACLFLDFDGVLHSASSDAQLAHFCWLPLLESLLLAH